MHAAAHVTCVLYCLRATTASDVKFITALLPASQAPALAASLLRVLYCTGNRSRFFDVADLGLYSRKKLIQLSIALLKLLLT